MVKGKVIFGVDADVIHINFQPFFCYYISEDMYSMLVYKDQGIDWQPQSDSLGVSPSKQTQSNSTFVSGLCCLVGDLRQLTCFLGCFSQCD